MCAKNGSDSASADETNLAVNRAARRTGVRGETFAYWYLRKNGYVIVSRNFMVPGVKGEIDLAGYDGKVLAFIEVKTRTSDADEIVNAGERKILPEDAMNAGKRHSLVRMAKMFMTEWRIKDGVCRFDVLAIESQPGKTPGGAFAQRLFWNFGKSLSPANLLLNLLHPCALRLRAPLHTMLKTSEITGRSIVIIDSKFGRIVCLNCVRTPSPIAG